MEKTEVRIKLNETVYRRLQNVSAQTGINMTALVTRYVLDGIVSDEAKYLQKENAGG